MNTQENPRKHRVRLLILLMLLGATTGYSNWSTAELVSDAGDHRRVVLAFQKPETVTGSSSRASTEAGGRGSGSRGAATTSRALHGDGGSRSEGVPAKAASVAANMSDRSDIDLDSGGSIGTLSGRRAEGDAVATSEPSGRSGNPIETILERGLKFPRKILVRTDRSIDHIIERVNQTASRLDEGEVAGRLSSEFGVGGTAIRADIEATGGSLGDAMVAYTLAGQKNNHSARALLELEAGRGRWAAIAAGLGLDLDATVAAVHVEAKVALGQAPPDGKLAAITSGPGRADRKVGCSPGSVVGASAGLDAVMGVTTGIGGSTAGAGNAIGASGGIGSLLSIIRH